MTIVLGKTEGRGPHHPRGEKVSKHHVHYRPTRGTEEKLTQDTELLHDTEHIEEHLQEYISDPDLTNLTDEEIEFYYFQVHDTDKNSKLDGLEILQAIMHTRHHKHKDDEEEDQDGEETQSVEDDDFNYYIELIDKVLSEDDKNEDGYLSYAEYVEGRKKEQNATMTEQVREEDRPAVSLVE